MIPVPKNKLQEQFEFEKAHREKYGRVSSLTFEDWLKTKEHIEKKEVSDGKEKTRKQTHLSA